MGYEPVLHERGTIAYEKDSALEESCYREIDLCDILVSIIGGRYGSRSEQEPYSISQMELKHALEEHKQVYVFVEKNVLAEYSTYLKNKDKTNIEYNYVDNIAVYKFLEEIHALPQNNPITSFESSEEIVSYLKAQWAGIFQRLIQESVRREEIKIIKELHSSAETLNSLVNYLTVEKKDSNEAIKTILLSTHPAFEAVKSKLKIPYRVYFTSLDELSALAVARSWKVVRTEEWDEPKYKEWMQTKGNILILFKVFTGIFDKDGRLKVITKEEWKENFVRLEEREMPPPEPEDPFAS